MPAEKQPQPPVPPSPAPQRKPQPTGRAAGVEPPNRFEALHGDRNGQFSIRINEQWRICFEWPDGQPGPANVEIVDYHG